MTTHSRRLFTSNARFAVVPAADPNALPTLEGYAIVWNAISSDRGGYRAKIAPGTVSFEPTVHALYHHEYRDLLGSTAPGTLRLASDDYGVKVEIDLPDTSAGRDVATLVKRGDIAGMSFNMTTDPVGSVADGVMTLDPFAIDEVTVTAIPAFVDTTIQVKTPADAAAFACRRQQHVALDRLRLSRFQRLAAVPARRAM